MGECACVCECVHAHVCLCVPAQVCMRVGVYMRELCVYMCVHTWNWMILSWERQRYILSVSFR